MWRIYRYRFPWPWATGSRGVIFQMDLFNNVRTVWPRTTKFGRITHVVEGRICRGSATPLPQGGGAQAQSNFGGSLLFMHTPFDAELPNFKWQHMREGSCFWWSATQPPKRGRGPSAPQFWEFLSIYAYTPCHRTTNFDVVTHMGEGRVSWCQPCLPS